MTTGAPFVGLIDRMVKVYAQAAFGLTDVSPTEVERKGMEAVLRFIRTGNGESSPESQAADTEGTPRQC